MFFQGSDTRGATVTLGVQGWQASDSKKAEQLEANLQPPPVGSPPRGKEGLTGEPNNQGCKGIISVNRDNILSYPSENSLNFISLALQKAGLEADKTAEKIPRRRRQRKQEEEEDESTNGSAVPCSDTETLWN